MQISTKFTIAVHLLTAVAYFSESQKVTSDFLAGSIGSNPVIIRNIMGQLKEAGLIDIKRGPFNRNAVMSLVIHCNGPVIFNPVAIRFGYTLNGSPGFL